MERATRLARGSGTASARPTARTAATSTAAYTSHSGHAVIVQATWSPDGVVQSQRIAAGGHAASRCVPDQRSSTGCPGSVTQASRDAAA